MKHEKTSDDFHQDRRKWSLRNHNSLAQKNLRHVSKLAQSWPSSVADRACGHPERAGELWFWGRKISRPRPLKPKMEYKAEILSLGITRQRCEHIMIQIWRVGLVGLFIACTYFWIAMTANGAYDFGHSVVFSCLLVSIICLFLIIASFFPICPCKWKGNYSSGRPS